MTNEMCDRSQSQSEKLIVCYRDEIKLSNNERMIVCMCVIP